MQKGGPVMWVLLACSLLAIAVFLSKMLQFHRAAIHVGEFLEGLAVLIRSGRYAEALHEAAGTPGPVSRVVQTVLANHDAPPEELRLIVQEAGQLEVPDIEHNLPVLSTIAYVAPLLGLIGTVSGLIGTFEGVSATSGYTTGTDLAAGIHASLISTATGLTVAVAVFTIYGYLSAWADTFLHEMERAGIEVVHMVCQRARSGGKVIDQPQDSSTSTPEAT